MKKKSTSHKARQMGYLPFTLCCVFGKDEKKCSKEFASLGFAFYITVAFHCVCQLQVFCILQTIFDTFIKVPNLFCKLVDEQVYGIRKFLTSILALYCTGCCWRKCCSCISYSPTLKKSQDFSSLVLQCCFIYP